MSDDEATDVRRIDADGGLVVAPFTSPHLHLCKVHTLGLLDDAAIRAYAGQGMGDALRAIDLASAVKEHYRSGWIADHATRALIEGLGHGVLTVRAFADVDTRAGLAGVSGVLEAKRRLAGLVDVQVVAFPQDGLVRDPGALALVDEALSLGADVVGGIPWIERTDSEAGRHIDLMFDLAVDRDLDVAMLVDDAGDPDLRTTQMLAETAIARGWEGRVTACHARALGLYPRPRLARLAELARDAGLAFVANPHTGPLHLPLFEMREMGLTVALGQDDIVDAYYPFGTHDLVEVAFLVAHVLHRYTEDDAATLLDMITDEAAVAVGLPRPRLDVGAPASMVVLEGSTPREVLRRHAAPRTVIRDGEVLAQGTRSTSFAASVPAIPPLTGHLR